MSLPRLYAARKDANEREIVATVVKAGAVWYPSDGVGCDGWCGFDGRWEALEIKDGSKSPSRRKLTEFESQMQLVAHLHRLPYRVVSSVDEALAALGIGRAEG